jgi:hypothetical protein
MAALDTQLAGLLQTQAAEVQDLRVYMGLSSGLLFPIGYLAALGALASGPTACYAIQTVFATACLSLDGWLHDEQKVRAQTTGAAMQTVADGYTQIAAEAQAALPMHS